MQTAILNEGDPIDPSLLDAFSSDLAAQQALLPIVIERMRRDAEEGRALMNAYLTDPDLRRQAEQGVESGRGMTGVPNMIAPFPAIGGAIL